MNVAKMAAGALAGGLIGAGLWAAVVYATGYEIGWIAWALGGLSGFGVRLAGPRETSHFDRRLKRMVRERSAPAGRVAGGVAALVAVASVVAGKALVAHLLLPAPAEVVEETANDEAMIAYLANDVAREYEAEGRELAWPPGVPPFEALEPDEFPQEIWSSAQRRWNAMSLEERNAYAEHLGETYGDAVATVDDETLGTFASSLSALDVLWLALASATAFKIGASAGG